jgi:very-short-patch-repair endonuclease
MEPIERPYFYGASPEIFERAKALRCNMTEAEKALWEKLRRRQIKGLKFHRQHPISKFIVDFYCHERSLVIEIDGEVHNNTEAVERDKGREYELQKLGLKVIRFNNQEVIGNIELVVKLIFQST